MSLNLTAAWLEARLSPSMLHFSATVTTSNTFLNGPGGASGDGFPMTQAGVIRSLSIWDGSTLHTAELDIAFDAGDRLALSALCDTTYTVSLLRNYVTMPLFVSGLPTNSTYYATVDLLLKEDA
ncbi:hypothetical protein KQI52_05435 [bacterium]|nr:hypothetical protein [bacterium]